jgi:hypothetical protein
LGMRGFHQPLGVNASNIEGGALIVQRAAF